MMNELRKEIQKVRDGFGVEIDRTNSPAAITEIRHRYLGRKKGIVSDFYGLMRQIADEEKPIAGKEINDLRAWLEEKIQQREASFAKKSGSAADYSLPESELPVGHFHLISHIQGQIEAIFQNMGYDIALGPEVETEFNNFSALNIPADHPVREEHDTFFIDGCSDLLLRTHTSPVQIRYMMAHKPPIQIISPGKVFRKDDPDATHTPVFHQVEGLLVDRQVTFSHLKGTLEQFIRLFFGAQIQSRFRPSFFPFTEPSAEVDISCYQCRGDEPECRICKGKGWLEILGCGMVHPQVLRNCQIDAEVYSGFAFGLGVERMAIIKFGIPDLRLLYENDLRLLQQYG